MLVSKKNGWLSSVITICLALAAYWIYHNSGPENKTYTVFYNNVKGLQASSPIMIRGVRVGKIDHITIDTGGKVRVEFHTNNDIILHNGAAAILKSAGVISDKSINIIDGIDSGVIANGSTLPSAIDTASMETEAKVTPYIITAKYLLRSTDSSLRSIKALTSSGIFTAFVIPLSSFQNSMQKYALMSSKLNDKAPDLINKINTASASSKKLSNNTKNLKETASNTATKLQKLGAKNIGQQIDTLCNNINGLSKAIKAADKLASASTNTYNTAIREIDTIHHDIRQTYTSPRSKSILGKSKKKK